MQDLKIALIQTHLHWHDKPANLNHFSLLLDKITDHPDLIVLPEMFNTGFSMDAHLLYESMDGSSVNWMISHAKEKNAVIAGSMIIKENDYYFNRLIAAHPNGTIQTYDKRHLFRMAHEDANFTQGEKNIIINSKGWKIRPFVCYDLRFPVWSRNRYDIASGWDYDLAVYVANWPAVRTNAWKAIAVARAIENQSYVIALNRIGMDGKGHKYSGDSQVINSYGEVLSHLGDKEYIEIISLDREKLEKHRKDFPVGMDADGFELNK
jgi:omega-amidase